MLIPIYNKLGNVVNYLELAEDVVHDSGRVSKAVNRRVYYKGVGVTYKGHSMLKPDKDVTVVRQHPIFYYGWEVFRPAYADGFGLFQEKMQPYFSDFIGGCGPKEKTIIQKSRDFEFSSVRYLDHVEYDTENKQSYYVLEYLCNRKSFIPNGNVDDLINLLDYMLDEGWCFPFDKTGINDVSFDGRIHDVADLFRSKEQHHQLGTVYTMFYSLAQLSKLQYNQLINRLKLKFTEPVLAAFAFLNQGNDYVTDYLLRHKESAADLQKLRLLPGRNCGYVEDANNGEKIAKMMVKKWNKANPGDKIKINWNFERMLELNRL